MAKVSGNLKNHQQSKKKIGYTPRKKATEKTYSRLGFKSGLEIHQQLKTKKKLFCNCPAGIYQDKDQFDAEVIRHMRPTLSELGEYDGTALMEFKTKKNITYKLKNETACTYDIDDTPPFPLNREALDIAIEIALLLKTSIVGELHITRKQYLDGSIPTGFQRTAIVGIDGKIPLKSKNVGIIQLSIEEDSCREVADIGHSRIYTTDRLGIPLIEAVTFPDMLTPDQVAEAAHYIRFLTRSTGKVRTGIGAAREDVNVSISGGTRVEIKGVSHISWIPELTHNEAYRQKALLDIKEILISRKTNGKKWQLKSKELTAKWLKNESTLLQMKEDENYKIMAINLPGFKNLLSFFTQPDRCFADELSDRLKVIACLEKPNMTHNETFKPEAMAIDFKSLQELLKSSEGDAQLVLWGPAEDISTAIETIEERCQLAFQGVPNETRKAFVDGTTIFERVLPGPDRMYPDTDSAPIAIGEKQIDSIRQQLPNDVVDFLKELAEWEIPTDAFTYILKRNLFGLVKKIIEQFKMNPVFVGTLIGQRLKHLEGQIQPVTPFDYQKIFQLCAYVSQNDLQPEILKPMLSILYEHPNMDFGSILTTIGFRRVTEKEILDHVSDLMKKFKEIQVSKSPTAESLWIMGQLSPLAVGNMSLKLLRSKIRGGGA